MEIKGVKIGDRFNSGKHLTAEVVDLIEKRSLADGEVKGHICIARAEGLSSNCFEVPFSTVLRNKII